MDELFQAVLVLLDCLFEAEVEGVGDKGMADGHFVEIRQTLVEELQVLKAQVMAGIDAETAAVGHFGCLHKRSDSRFRIRWIHGGVRFGVEFHTVGAGLGSEADVLLVRSYEDAGTDACFLEAVDYLGEEVEVGSDVPSGIGREGIGSVRHERDLSRFHEQHELDELLGRIAFDVELRAENRTEPVDVVAADVTLVGTGMHCDAVGTEALAVDGYFFHVGDIAATGVADGGYFIYVYT